MKTDELRKPGVVRFLQIHLTEHCNLNCKGCTHFSPVAKEEYLDLDYLKKVYSNLKPFLEKWFCRLELLGGEPLLHPNVEEILSLTRGFFGEFEVRLVTNGLKLMDMPDSFYRCCAANKITIAISVYPVGLDYPAIEKKLAAYSIAYKYYGEYETCKTFRQYKLNPKGIYNSRDSFERCKYAGHCFQLRENRVFPCFISAYASHLNDYYNLNFEWREGDYIQLDHDVSEEEFLALATEAVPFCAYCNMSDPAEFVWDYSKKELSEWIDPNA